MRVSIQTVDGNQVTINVSSAFKVLVDDEVLLDHSGPVGCKKACKGPYSAGSDASSLFDDIVGTFQKMTEQRYSQNSDEYIHCKAIKSSFIDSWQWWSFEPCIGDGALEIYFKNGNYVSYSGVPLNIAKAFEMAIHNGESAGRFFNAHIKNVYEIFHEGEDA
jgi:hypothetical protein